MCVCVWRGKWGDNHHHTVPLPCKTVCSERTKHFLTKIIRCIFFKVGLLAATDIVYTSLLGTCQFKKQVFCMLFCAHVVVV